MRSIWKGHIQFSLVTIPVRIYNAFDAAQKIKFNLLTKEGHNPVGYEKKDKVTGKPLNSEDIVKGYQYGEGQYVIITKEDLEKVKLKSTKVIEIEGFVDEKEVPPVLFDTPYFIGPDSEIAAKNYELFAQTLKQTGKTGVGKVVLRDREHPVLLAAQNGGMILYRLRYPSELRNFEDVPYLTEVEANKEQLNLAKTLVDSMSVNFSEIEMKDRYYDALKEIIEAKIEGKEVVTVREEEPDAVDIMTALKASIESAKKPMEKAKGEKKGAEKKSAKGKSKTG
ncbi:Ku protein [Aliifodinibius sp. S!AR15-10]|uniref:non-homologous end joining protein Ku n=1 Tax=Aliifodinibius sp. S!AR15-10 TaxID=2950437 RepID=UPI0028679EF5|nr:Ku protein [Aliifodinibius sp. S!AR15-10]MDR8392592.1 Ku protein [Aliifodinibius sp. S!AR15-10]